MQTTVPEETTQRSPTWRWEGGTVVIKLGGSVHDPRGGAWAADLARLVQDGLRPVLVHGGGPELTRWMQRLGLEARFIAGHRVTCAETAVLAQMVFTGSINKQIVSALQAAGVRATGSCGSDAGLLRVRRHRPGGHDAGYVGAVDEVDPRLLHLLLGEGYVPVISPVATDATGQPYNINADVVAGALAAALTAEELLFLCDVPGFMAEGRRVARLDAASVQDLLARRAVDGGMVPKLEATLEALRAGVRRVRLVDGRVAGVLQRAFRGGEEIGTNIVDAAREHSIVDVTPRQTGVDATHATVAAGKLAARGERVFMRTYAREPLEIAAASGCRIRDVQGRTYLDFASGIAVNALGHGHPRIVAALQQGAASLVHTSNLYWTEPGVRLAERLVAATRMERAFFCNSGAEAIEAGLKWARKARPERRKTVIFSGSFHGRTLGALSATAREAYQAPFRPLLADFVEVPFGDFDAADSRIDAETALVVVEPVQGEGGVRVAPCGFLSHLRALCDRHGALLLFDEVQTGVGRTGTFLACEADAVLPDAVTLAKALAGGLPIGVLLTRGEAAQAFAPGDHGSTFGGGPLVASVALAVLDQILEPGFLVRVQQRGARLHGMLQRIAVAFPQQVCAVRGRGLMAGVVLHEPWAAEWMASLRDQGLLALQAGKDVLRLLPPLIVEEDEIDVAEELLQQTLAQRQSRRATEERG